MIDNPWMKKVLTKKNPKGYDKYLKHLVKKRKATLKTKSKTKKGKKQKNKSLKDETGDKVLFVFYTFDNTESWSYGKFPKGWRWVGSGSTAAVGKKKSKYEQEEQFMGPEKTRKNMHNYLDKYFKNLKKNKVIKIYKVENSYSP